jgi:hypothetical protein
MTTIDQDRQAALLSWLVNSTGLVWVWEDEPRGHILRTPAYGVLSGPHSVTPRGQDWLVNVTVEVSPGEFIVEPHPRGIEIATYKARVISSDQSADTKASKYLRMARMALRLPVVKDAWFAAGMSLATSGQVQLFPAPSLNDRMDSIASMQFTVNQMVDDAVDGDDRGFVEHFGVSSSLTPLGVPPNLVGELIPPED